MIKKEVIGSSMVLLGGLLLVLLFMSANQGVGVTGNFIADDFGSNSITGLSILDNSTNKMIAYAVFLIIIGIGVLLIALSSWKKKELKLGKVKKRKIR